MMNRKVAYRHTDKCRVCGSADLVPVIDLGSQYLTGVFPKTASEEITSGPLELVKCRDDNGQGCGLVQLLHSYDSREMYGENYGYRSGLNQSMVDHLNARVRKLRGLIPLNKGDLVIDIGSNDSTLLRAYGRQDGLTLAGIDPTGEKFRKYYPQGIELIPDFFSAGVVRKNFSGKKAKIITSIAMFYDLESPVDFSRQISEVLSDDGVWFFEQSYMPSMLEMNAYDTICHEHLEYYGLKQVKWIMDKAGLKILDVEFNKVNGGSFSVIAARQRSRHLENKGSIHRILIDEKNKGLESLKPFEEFRRRVFDHRAGLLKFIRQAKSENKKIFGYGASTKGNVILQYCGISRDEIPCIAEINSDKFGCYTPGTGIPIIPEAEARQMKPDYFLALPWHFREGIMKREKDYLDAGGKFIFPLPLLEVAQR